MTTLNLTSRAELVRRNSAILQNLESRGALDADISPHALSQLRRQFSLVTMLGRPPSLTEGTPVRRANTAVKLLKKSSYSNLDRAKQISSLVVEKPTLLDEEEDEVATELFYCSGWNAPRLHYKIGVDGGDSSWTEPPGSLMKLVMKNGKVHVEGVRPKPIAIPPAIQKISDWDHNENVWYTRLSGVESVEFVPNNEGRNWDKAPGDQNYRIDECGTYYLRRGRLQEVIDAPGKPVMLHVDAVGSSWVHLTWNPPIEGSLVVSSYRIYMRSEHLVTLSTGKTTRPEAGVCVGEVNADDEDRIFIHGGLLGNEVYTYCMDAVNRQGEPGPLSDTVVCRTSEPDRPSEPIDLVVDKHTPQSITLRWHAPVDLGGARIMHYFVYRNGARHAMVPASGADECFTDSDNVVRGEWYAYSVTASNFPEENVAPLPKIDAKSSAEATKEKAMSEITSQRKSEMEEQFIIAANALVQPKESRVASVTWAQAVTMFEYPRIYDKRTHILLQAFNWNSCYNKNGWYSILGNKAVEMREAGITMAWLPPPSQSVSPQGYMPSKLFQLDSSYGTSKDLKACITDLKTNGISAMVDLVVNHRCGSKKDDQGQWTIYEEPEWGSWAIVSNNTQGYQGTSTSVDTGAQSTCAPDIDHTNKKVREDLKEWIRWLFSNEVGFSTIRIDMAPGYSPKYQVEYIEHVGSPLAVGEYWSGDQNCLHNYVNSTRNRIAAFDFALYYVLRRSVESNNFWEMNNNGRLNGLIGRDPERSVTFLDNHDTVHLDFVGKFASGNHDAILRGYAVLLTHPGIPCIYWDHWSDYGQYVHNKIMELGQARHKAGIHSTSGIHIDSAEEGLYAAYVDPNRHCHRGGGTLAMKVGSRNWQPQGSWKKFTSGNDYCVWLRP